LDPGDFRIGEGAHVVLRGLTILRGGEGGVGSFGAIENSGTLLLEDSTVSESCCWWAITSFGDAVLRVQRSAIIGNPNAFGIAAEGDTIIQNSTVTGNLSIAVLVSGDTRLLNSTVSGLYVVDGITEMRGSVVSECVNNMPPLSSLGYNIESPGDTCGLDQPTDQVNVTEEQLNLGPLADNGGPTETHALLPGSVAIDVIPAEMCEVDTDQRGVDRPQGDACDVGAVEMEVAP
jgi:hypothetical protein